MSKGRTNSGSKRDKRKYTTFLKTIKWFFIGFAYKLIFVD